MQPNTDFLLQNFHDNLNFFEQSYPALFQKLLSLETALVKGYYEPAYELVYDNGYFDVTRLATGKPYYGRDSNQEAQEAASSINYKKTEGVFETFLKPECHGVEGNDILADHTNAVCSFSHYSHDATDGLETMEKIHKFIFMGVGLGFHLQTIHRKIGAGAYLIVEDDLELFRLSMFTTRYMELAQISDVEFSVFENDAEFDRTVSSFLNKGFFFNHTIKYHFMGQHLIEKVKLIQHAILTQKHLRFAYHNMLRKALRPLEYIEMGYRFLNIAQSYPESPFSRKPVLMIAAGPSLQTNSEWLAKNHHSYTIVAVSAALRTLGRLGITPDIVTHIDGFEASIGHFQGHDEESLAKSLLIAGTNSYPGIMPYFQKENVFLFDTGSSYFENMGSLSTPCVGSSTYLLLLKLGVKNLYLLGLDLALDQATGSTHAEAHIANAQISLSDANRIEQEASVQTTLLRVKGNFGEDVLSVPQLKQSLDDLYIFVPECIRDDQQVYNLGSGAYIPGSTAKHPEDTVSEGFESLPEKRIFQEKMTAFLRVHSRAELNEKECESYRKRLAYVADIRRVIENHSQGEYADFGRYQLALFALIKATVQVGTEESKDIGYILLTYYKLVLSYIFDMFNTRGLTHQEQHVKYVKQVLSAHLAQIVEAYETRLDTFWKNR